MHRRIIQDAYSRRDYIYDRACSDLWPEVREFLSDERFHLRENPGELLIVTEPRDTWRSTRMFRERATTAPSTSASSPPRRRCGGRSKKEAQGVGESKNSVLNALNSSTKRFASRQWAWTVSSR